MQKRDEGQAVCRKTGVETVSGFSREIKARRRRVGKEEDRLQRKERKKLWDMLTWR